MRSAGDGLFFLKRHSTSDNRQPSIPHSPFSILFLILNSPFSILNSLRIRPSGGASTSRLLPPHLYKSGGSRGTCFQKTIHALRTNNSPNKIASRQIAHAEAPSEKPVTTQTGLARRVCPRSNEFATGESRRGRHLTQCSIPHYHPVLVAEPTGAPFGP